MKQLLTTLAAALVSEPEHVRVAERSREGKTVLELSVARGDFGRIIGREGRTSAALRTLLEAVGRRRGQPCELEIRQ